jgi:hypothetical protein
MLVGDRLGPVVERNDKSAAARGWGAGGLATVVVLVDLVLERDRDKGCVNGF